MSGQGISLPLTVTKGDILFEPFMSRMDSVDSLSDVLKEFKGLPKMKVFVSQDVTPPSGDMTRATNRDCDPIQSGEAGKNQECLDVVTMVCKNNELIRWSRAELGNLSEYFQVLLYGNFCERSLHRIEFRHVEAEILKAVLTFYDKYQSKILNHDDPNFCRIFIKDFNTAWKILEISDMLGLEEAASECDKYIIQTLDPKRCSEVIELAEQFTRCSIQREAVKAWVVGSESSKCNQPCQHFSDSEELCPCVYAKKYRKIDRLYVVGGYFYEHFRNCDCVEADSFLLTKESSKQSNHSESLKESSPKSNRVSSFNAGQCYPGPHNEECRVTALETDIYVTGGFDHKAKAIKQVWKYDTRKNEWSRVSDMRHSRFYHCIASVGTHIYVCGGYDDDFVLNSLERYHPHYNEWVYLDDMPTGVGNAAYASDDHGIYVTCGQYGYKEIHTTNKVQHYSVATDQWSVLTNYESPVFFPHSEYGLSSAVITKKLVILGGQTERCDIFDLEKGEWKRASNMNCRRMETSVTNYRGKVYAAGGYDYKTGDYHDTVEEYDPESDEWKIIPQRLPRPVRSMGFCHVFDVERIA